MSLAGPLKARIQVSDIARRVRSCEKMSRQAPAGAKESSRVVDPATREGKRSAAPGNGERYTSPGRGDRNHCSGGLSVAPPGLLAPTFQIPGLRFACPGLLSARRSAAESRFIHTFAGTPERGSPHSVVPMGLLSSANAISPAVARAIFGASLRRAPERQSLFELSRIGSGLT